MADAHTVNKIKRLFVLFISNPKINFIMKKLFLLSILLSVVCATHAQTEFSVPAPTLEEKNNMNKMLMHNNLLGLITVAKNEGTTAEELGKKSGTLAFPYWDENSKFEQFVNFALYAWACMAENVQIIEQSNEKLVVMFSSMYQPLEEQGVFLGTTIEDYTAFHNAAMSAVAIHLGYTFEMTWGEEGYRAVITK